MKQINQTMLKLITIFCMNHKDSSSHFPFIDDFLIRKGKNVGKRRGEFWFRAQRNQHHQLNYEKLLQLEDSSLEHEPSMRHCQSAKQFLILADKFKYSRPTILEPRPTHVVRQKIVKDAGQAHRKGSWRSHNRVLVNSIQLDVPVRQYKTSTL